MERGGIWGGAVRSSGVSLLFGLLLGPACARDSTNADVVQTAGDGDSGTHATLKDASRSALLDAAWPQVDQPKDASSPRALGHDAATGSSETIVGLVQGEREAGAPHSSPAPSAGEDASVEREDTSDGASFGTSDLTLADLPDADASPPDVDSALPSVALMPCEERYPGYDCELSRSVWDNAAVVPFSCGGCHSVDNGGVAPFIYYDTDYGDHDVALGYIDLDVLSESRLVNIVRDEEHYCAGDCEERAQEITSALYDWQWKLAARSERLALIDSAAQRWQEQGINSYEWTIQNVCFACLQVPQANATVVVNEGEVQRLFGGDYRSEPAAELEPEQAWTQHTVSGLFELLRKQVSWDPDDVQLSFDDELGYPRSAMFDYDADGYDEEDDFRATYLRPLGAGYCMNAAPFHLEEAPIEEQSCATESECASCAAHSPQAVDCPWHSCNSGAECLNGSVCVEYAQPGCQSAGSYCRRPCAEEACPTGYQCEDAVYCVATSCADDPAQCLASERCQPDSPFADLHGCLPPSCVDSGIDCGPIAECKPDSVNAGADDCAALACGADADCPCGSCVNALCALTPGYCAPLGRTATASGPPPSVE